ncbi:MAG: amino acid adenylation domain-containing protein, partial [Catenulispora sp.]|nr:amino acid adenylation domain-containing protein [Catenulispora sp.]
LPIYQDGAATLHGLVAAQAARTPHAPAVLSDDAGLTYAELEARAETLAARLAARGVGRNDLVAVALDRSPDLVAGMLAVLKTGAAYVPIDMGYPAGRIGQMLDDARPVVALTSRAAVGRLPAGFPAVYVDEPAVFVDEPGADSAAELSRPPHRQVQPHPEVLPDEAAYVVYTSGSTGRPKGVVVSHRSVVAYLTWMQAEYPLGPDDRFVQKSPTGFDGAVLEFYPVLCVGGAVVLARPDGHREPEYVAGLIARQRVTVAQFVPSLLPVFLDDEFAASCKTLRRVFSGSEALPAAVQEQFRQRFDAELVNLYGPTEATVDVASWRCESDPGSGVVPLGFPAYRTRIEVLDSHLRRVAPGEPGELYVSGVQLARGYLGRPGLTCERFVADPYGAPGERMYRTGDVGRRRADGVLEFVGRVDDQVKVGGVRVEPAEVEAALLEHPAVRQAAAKAVTTPGGQLRLAAWVALDQGSTSDADLREFLRARLPEAAVPSRIVFLDELPQNAHEKLDRAALTLPDQQTEAETADRGDLADPADPVDETERELLTAVRDILGVDRVTLTEGFIAQGGDSISAIRLAGRARRAGLSVTTGDVLRAPTLADLLDIARYGQVAAEQSDPEAVGRFDPTPIMRWLHDVGGPLDAFSQSMVLRTPADLTEDELTACLQAIIDRHDMLRARFIGAADKPWQPEVLPVGTVTASSCLRVESAEQVPDLELRPIVRAGLEHARSELSISAPRMLQAIWYRRTGRQGRLALLVNHLAVDGVSLRILQSDLAQAWLSLRRSGTPHVAPVPVAFRRWAGLLQQDARAPRRRKELSYWKGSLSAQPLMPGGRALDPAVDTIATARTRRFDLPAELTEPLLNRAPAAFGTDINAVLLAGLALALGQWREGADLSIALEGHGRHEVFPGVDPDRTVGWFTTLFPVRIGLDGADRTDPRRALARIASRLAAVPDKGLGFGLLRYLNPETAGALGSRPQPELLVNYLGRFGEAETDDWALDADHDVALDEADGAMPLAFAVEVNCLAMPREAGHVFSAVWTWAAGVVDDEAVARLAELWFARLAELAALAVEPPPPPPAATAMGSTATATATSPKGHFPASPTASPPSTSSAPSPRPGRIPAAPAPDPDSDFRAF